jgi:hypothetical protein
MKNKLFIAKSEQLNTHKEEILWFLIGVFITMPVLVLRIGNISLAIYNIFLFIAFCYRYLKSGNRIIFYSYKTPLYIFILCLALSGIFSFFSVPTDWSKTSIRATLKLLLVLIMMSFFYSDDDLAKCKKYFFKGIIFSAPIQLIWIVIQYFSWSLFQIKLNTILFGVKTSMEALGGITLTGLSWERADIVLVFSLVTALSHNKLMKLICLIGTIMTASRSGLIMILSIYVYQFIVYLLNRKNLKKQEKNNIILVLSSIIIFLAVIFILCLIYPDLINGLINRFQYTISRIIGVFTNKNDYGLSEINPHILYFIWLPSTLLRSSIIQVLFGSGTRVSGWMYMTLYGRFAGSPPWSVECDFISLILGNGIIAALFYYYVMIKSFVINKNQSEKAIIFMMFFASFLYQFYASTLGLIIIIFCFAKVKAKRDNEIHENYSDNVDI